MTSLNVYGGLVRHAVLRMKRRGSEPLARALAEEFWTRQSCTMKDWDVQAVTPVPHHWTDRLSQAHLRLLTLSRFIAGRLGVPVMKDLVAKVRRTPSQARLVPSQRRLNLVGAFRPTRRLPAGVRSVLIVDDVLTTGVTAHRLAMALRDAGAQEINVAVIARSVGDFP